MIFPERNLELGCGNLDTNIDLKQRIAGILAKLTAPLLAPHHAGDDDLLLKLHSREIEEQVPVTAINGIYRPPDKYKVLDRYWLEGHLEGVTRKLPSTEFVPEGTKMDVVSEVFAHE